MSIIIFGDSFTFPEGNAATNRVHTYAKGLHENGIDVHVICFASRYNTPGDGITNGIHYYHPFGQRKRNKYFLIRRYQKILKYFKTILIIRRINKSDKVITFICYTQTIQTLIFTFLLAKYIKTKVILERSEHPLRYFNGKVFSNLYIYIKLAFEVKLFDGIFCISNYLIDFYSNKGVHKRKLFLVPSTVDAGRFDKNYDSPLPYQYILYCGSLTIIKDGVNILIESFARIAEKYPEINLVLVGEADSFVDEMIFRNLVIAMKLDNRVVFCGKLPRTDIPAYLCNAKILALARPKSIIAEAGFPSKLTEYLASGIPVVVTKVGEISLYLRDNENAFLSKPDSIDEFAAKLDFVLSNYKLAIQVGEKGKELTSSIFNCYFQATRMIDFMSKLDD